MISKIIIWMMTFWIIFQISYSFSYRSKFKQKYKSLIDTTYFIIVSFILYLFIHNKIVSFIPLDNWFIIIFTFIYLVVTAILGDYINRKLPIPKQILERWETPFFFNFDIYYIFSKFADILFQQLMILWLISILITSKLSITSIILTFIAIFTLLHIPAFFKHKWFSLFFIVLSFVGGFILPLLIITLNYGIFFSIILHFSVYLISRLIFGIYYSKKVLVI